MKVANTVSKSAELEKCMEGLKKPKGNFIRIFSIEVPRLTFDNDELSKIKEQSIFEQMDKVVLGKEIGEGRFGAVLCATMKGTNKPTAVRIFETKAHPPCLSKGSKLSHSGLLKMSAPKIFHEYTYVTMELGDMNVYDDVMNNGKYSEMEAKIVMKQLMKGLGYLHGKNIIHGNLHTKNIIICDGTAKIADYTNGKVWKHIYYSKVTPFALPYIAPELNVPAPMKINRVSDMWSLGVCLFFMLTGQSPFTDRSRQMIDMAKRSEAVFIPTDLGKMIQHIISNLLTADPAKRMSLPTLKNHEWFDYMSSYYKRKFGVENSTAVEKEDEQSEAELANGNKYQRLIAEGEKEEKRLFDVIFPGFVGGTTNGLGVIVTACGPNSTGEVDICHLMFGGRSQPCLRISIPISRKDELVAEAQKMMPGSGKYVVSKCGNYVLMDFTEDGVRFVEALDDEQMSAKQANARYSAQDAKLLWESVKLEICQHCSLACKDSKNHDTKDCIYRYLAEAPLSNDLIQYYPEDKHRVRFVTLPIEVYTPPEIIFPLLRHRSVRYLVTGMWNLYKKFRC